MRNKGVRQGGDFWLVVSVRPWRLAATVYTLLYSVIFCKFFFRNLTTMLVLIEETLLYLQPFLLGK
jgi:hypothetical protein